jgi:hypothetical protein
MHTHVHTNTYIKLQSLHATLAITSPCKNVTANVNDTPAQSLMVRRHNHVKQQRGQHIHCITAVNSKPDEYTIITEW